MNRRAPYLWMLLGSVAFAIMGTLAHGLHDACDWRIVALTRSSLAFVFAFALTRAAGARFAVWSPGILWVRSLAGSVSLICTFYALPRLPQSEVFTLTNVFPLWVALLCWPLQGQRPTPELMLALASGLTGVVLIQQPSNASGNFAAIIALMASFATAVAMLGLNHLSQLDPRAIVVHFSGVSALACLGCIAVGGLGPWQTPEPTVVFMLLGVGVTATAGQLCLTKAFASGPPARVSLVGLTQIPLAMLLDVVVWHHGINGLTLLGTALVLGPTAWVMSGASKAGALATQPSVNASSS